MIDAYEQKHGPVDDRSIFDGEIIVPPHLRNMSINSLKSSRLHGSLFGSISRSRTFLNLSANARHSYHGSVPDLSLNQFTFINPINAINVTNDDQRRMSSSSSATKITMNSSTTLTLSDSNYFSNSTDINCSINSSMLCRMNSTSVSTANDQNTMDNNNSCDFMPMHDPKLNRQRTSTNRIQMQKLNDQKRFLYCKSLDRPMRTQKPIGIYGTNSSTTSTASTHYKSQRSSSIDTNSDSNSNSNANDSYMTLIHTNVPMIQRVTLNRGDHGPQLLRMATSLHDINLIETIQPQMTTTTSTFQRKNPPQMQNNQFDGRMAAGLSRDLTLDNVTKFKLPRVTLGHPSRDAPPVNGKTISQRQ